MKKLLPVLFIALMMASCGSDDDKTFVDGLVGEYDGTLKMLNCALPQVELSNEASTAEITKKSETEIDFTIANTSGTVFNFSATVNADSTITIPEFTANQEMLKGSASNNSKLRIVLGDGCIIFGSEAATYTFDEI